MILIGVDPGSRVLGWGVLRLEGKRPVYVDCGALSAPPKDDAPARLAYMAEGLAEVIARHRPELAAVEKAFFGKSAASALRMGEARGVALAELARTGVRVEEITPAEVKRSVCGHGAADKERVQRMVAALLGLRGPIRPMDASDALAIALCLAKRTCSPIWQKRP